jgi:hypothetical protein
MAKSGPKTAAGRRAVRLNAVKHGVSSESPVIPGVQSEAEWQKFRAAWVESLAPVGFVEEQFAEETAILWWRKQRAHRYERDAAALRLAAWTDHSAWRVSADLACHGRLRD